MFEKENQKKTVWKKQLRRKNTEEAREEAREDFWIFYLDTLHLKNLNQKRALNY